MDYYLETYAGKCFKLKKAHELCKAYYYQRNNVINIANISVVTFIAVSNNITSSMNKTSSTLGVIYSIGLYLSIFISSLQKFLQYEKLTERHRIGSVRYNNLYNAIIMYIIIEKHEDENGKEEFVKWVNTEFDLLYNETPSVPKEITVKVEGIDTDSIFKKIKDSNDKLDFKINEENKKNETKTEEPDTTIDMKNQDFDVKQGIIGASGTETDNNKSYLDKAMMYQLKRMVCSYNE